MITCDSILETIGHTPIIHLKRVSPKNGAQVYAKYEAGNPSLSVKDRIAQALLAEGEAQGKINTKVTLVAATAGNTGVALAMVCAVKKYKLILFMPEDASLERRKMFDGYGAKLHVTPSGEGVPGSREKAKKYVQANPNCFFLDQFDNPVTVEAHKTSTAVEIIQDFPDGVDVLVSGVGTAGTIIGVGQVLQAKFPALKIIALEPKACPVLSGGKAGKHRIQQIGQGFVPKNFAQNLIDSIELVSDEEAYDMTKQLSEREGILAGISSGANVAVACRIAKKLKPAQKVLTFLCDVGQRYFSVERQWGNSA